MPRRLSTCSVTWAWVNEALEEFTEQVHIEAAHHGAGIIHVKFQARATREIDHYAGQRFIQWHIGMAITVDTFFIAYRLGKKPAQG